LCDTLCDILHMATNVQIDPDLIRDALLLGGKRTKREVIEEALQEYVLRRKQQQLLKLLGTVDYDPEYDYKKQRSKR
jgi:Arc/MetJ family transcription regulator